MLHDPNYGYDGQGKSSAQEAADSVRMLGCALIVGFIALAVMGGLLARSLITEAADPSVAVEVAGVAR